MMQAAESAMAQSMCAWAAVGHLATALYAALGQCGLAAQAAVIFRNRKLPATGPRAVAGSV